LMEFCMGIKGVLLINGTAVMIEAWMKTNFCKVLLSL
jgi:hypothetical protein